MKDSMLYTEYLECAKKHLKSCWTFLTSYEEDARLNSYVFLEIYYISGYIMEGLTVYSAYKHYGWPESKSIFEADEEFTNYCNIDFFPNRLDDNGVPVFPGRNKYSLNIHCHGFRYIVWNKLRNIPSFDTIPYFGNNTAIDDDVRLLIDKWRPDIRYRWTQEDVNNLHLNKDVLTRLLVTCSMIMNQIPTVI